MKNIEKLYCGDSGKACEGNETCVNGKCVKDVTPPPPEESFVKND